MIPVDGCFNLRDAGGWPIGDTDPAAQTMARGRLYRADDPIRLTPEGRAEVDKLGLRAVIDLRQHGRTKSGLGFVDPSRREHRPLVDQVINTDDPPQIDRAVHLTDLYESMLDSSQQQVAEVIDSIADHVGAGPVLVHCAFGKDRTGLVIALVQAAIGCSADSIVAEYALTDTPIQARTARLLAEPLPGDTDLRVIPPMLLRAPAEAMSVLVDRIIDRYGSLSRWVDSFPLATDTVDKLRRSLIVDAEAN